MSYFEKEAHDSLERLGHHTLAWRERAEKAEALLAQKEKEIKYAEGLWKETSDMYYAKKEALAKVESRLASLLRVVEEKDKALEEAEGAIRLAIMDDDGLDGGVGLQVLKTIYKALALKPGEGE